MYVLKRRVALNHAMHVLIFVVFCLAQILCDPCSKIIAAQSMLNMRMLLHCDAGERSHEAQAASHGTATSILWYMVAEARPLLYA